MSNSTARPLIYAELLSNIRQVSVGCTLPSECYADTTAIISPDGLNLTIRHEGEEISLQLPGQAAVSSDLLLHNKAMRSLSLSWRLPLRSAQTRTAPPTMETQPIPWSAQDLEAESSVCCRGCNATVVPQGVLKVWKNLPSENWAEMMEFWHCHKPHDHNHQADQGLTSRGYGASSRISSQAGVGFVDLASFIIAEADCIKSSLIQPVSTTEMQQLQQVSAESDPGGYAANGFKCQSNSLFCTSCGVELGVLDDETSSVTLFKWHLSLHRQTGQYLPSQPSLANCMSSMLMATLSRSGCSKSIILPLNHKSRQVEVGHAKTLLHIWLFNANIVFSSTQTKRGPTAAVKVLYRLVDQETANKMLDSMTSDVQDIALPIPAIKGVLELLRCSSEYLPPGERVLREWTVGLLEKWDGDGR